MERQTAELTRRARELNDAIARTEARIRELQGLPKADGEARSSRMERLLHVEVERTLPALEPERAAESLVDAMHRETGLLGAVRTRGSDVEWRALGPEGTRRRMEVSLEGGDSPRLRVRDVALQAPDSVRLIVPITSLMTWMVAGVLAVTMLTSRGSDLALPAMALAIVPAVLAYFAVMRRLARRALTSLADEVAESLPVRASRARVAEGTEAREEQEVEAGSAEEVRRGVS